MPSSPIFWATAALLLFWTVGAYNRLVRLRSCVIQAFGGLDAHLVRLMAMLGECDAAHASAQGPVAGARMALQAAVTQFGASLAVARARPLQPDAAAALSAGRDVLDAAWQALLRAREDEDGPAAVATWRQQWEQLQAQNALATRQLNDAVVQYNAAIAQFPPRVLAWLFGFKPARGL
ncbi:LemA family protein [Paenacidovorax monticola]|uniref:LemA family protein n=1 Tax=Paenacidovorax monticola TaxID=1926868 RepID=A0A7H0HCA2_9BURK|nr:LemA family protein [Paenacidovorax monticola]QNP58168.1 LemA family protein [Paenacidovorax monticola]